LPNRSKQVFGWTLALGFAIGFAVDSPAGNASKAADGGAVGQNAISAEADSHCAKAKADCPKASEGNCAKSRSEHGAKGMAGDAQITTGEGADCPKGAKCPKGSDCSKHGHRRMHKTGEAKAAPAGGSSAPAAPAAKPADPEKASTHPG
jgi:hypothetical protein